MQKIQNQQLKGVYIMNKITSLLASIVLISALIGCSGGEGEATIDVIKNRIIDSIQNSIGKGDIAIQKYKNRIVKAKGNLIKLKVNIKVYEQKVEEKKSSLQKLQNADRQKIVQSTIDDMESFLIQMKDTEVKLQNGLKKMNDNFDLIKMKISALEAKRDMLNALKSIQAYTSVEDDISGIDSSIDSTIESIQRDIYAIEAEMEIDKMFK